MTVCVFSEDLGPVARMLVPGVRVVGPEEVQQGDGAYGLAYAEGADAAALMLLERPGLLAGAVLLRPGRIAVPEPMPELEGVRVLAVPGRGGSHQVPQVLARAGAAVDLAVQDADSFLVPEDFALVRRWLGQFLEGGQK